MDICLWTDLCNVVSVPTATMLEIKQKHTTEHRKRQLEVATDVPKFASVRRQSYDFV